MMEGDIGRMDKEGEEGKTRGEGGEKEEGRNGINVNEMRGGSEDNTKGRRKGWKGGAKRQRERKWQKGE